eukprot:CAMPEP_0181236818 /NCGR_PEP_ID=MMETSP1096-20121128/38401_1 /TAXON_ID=156174 ORGANISM="Chrysochromulina ericina, Strain CCMP281" /NCGR_SAMPLE_ID=MMETSP1096 /ASSEMBLY_ACC=CAM_ASM_000453 /LENGTH=60 /DNA_ID=CAMNT_0023332069 /DNA_START=48 /DNA_END=226 /DNA_ORIENTATION=-
MKRWEDVKPYLRSELFSEMLALDVRSGKGGTSSDEMLRRWTESQRATKGADLDWLLATDS